MVRVYEIKMAPAKTEKEFFYVGIAHDPETGKRIVKFGTTNDLPRRRGEHRRHEYKKFPLHDCEYVSFVKLSQANTKRVEDSVRDYLASLLSSDEAFIRNDRYILSHNDPIDIRVTIKTKTYKFWIPALDNDADM